MHSCIFWQLFQTLVQYIKLHQSKIFWNIQKTFFSHMFHACSLSAMRILSLSVFFFFRLINFLFRNFPTLNKKVNSRKKSWAYYLQNFSENPYLWQVSSFFSSVGWEWGTQFAWEKFEVGKKSNSEEPQKKCRLRYYQTNMFHRFVKLQNVQVNYPKV